MSQTDLSRELYQSLWNAADILRGQMEANEYKSYLLGLIFYKYLSDNLLQAVCDNLDETFESSSKPSFSMRKTLRMQTSFKTSSRS